MRKKERVFEGAERELGRGNTARSSLRGVPVKDSEIGFGELVFKKKKKKMGKLAKRVLGKLQRKPRENPILYVLLSKPSLSPIHLGIVIIQYIL